MFKAAAEMALAIEQRARQEDDLVATVGRIDIPGGVVNSVPGIARFTLDVREAFDRAADDRSRSVLIRRLRRALEGEPAEEVKR